MELAVILRCSVAVVASVLISRVKSLLTNNANLFDGCVKLPLLDDDNMDGVFAELGTTKAIANGSISSAADSNKTEEGQQQKEVLLAVNLMLLVRLFPPSLDLESVMVGCSDDCTLSSK